MIQTFENAFVLHTDNTTYAIRLLPTGQPEHLYYGRRIHADKEEDLLSLTEKHRFQPGDSVVYDKEHQEYTLNDMCLEVSGLGKGDQREPFLELTHSDGSFTTDFVFKEYETGTGKEPMKTLPSSYSKLGDEAPDTDAPDAEAPDAETPDTEVPDSEAQRSEAADCEYLKIVLRDSNYDNELELTYYVFAGCDVITKTVRFINTSGQPVKLRRILSNQIDYADPGYVMTTFTGAWAREMKKTVIPVAAGTVMSGSISGQSSASANPFFMISRPDAGEDTGDVYGFNLIYSGNHIELAQVSDFGKLRVLQGINPMQFEYTVDPGEDFEAPEAVMTFSDKGANGMSRNMHHFIRRHIIRGAWADRERPILLNSWEAAYFNISEHRLLSLAKAAKSVGIELFVMDDGWFGERNDDSSSLGDWTPNKKKLPGGLKSIADKVNQLGMKFGIWVEPEMISENSNLYRNHPDWAVQLPGATAGGRGDSGVISSVPSNAFKHSEGRNQRILDLSNPAVQDYIIESMSDVFGSGNIEYVKWDMNRVFSDVYSKYLPSGSQGEMLHRYMIGLYRCMKELTERFPDILFEGCASGGNRFDLGILSYFPQIWGSDDTDAISRAEIMTGYSYGYPLAAVGAHVSGVPNHQTLRRTSLETRFNISAFGVLGYECNLADMSGDELKEIAAEIELYKKWRPVFFRGEFFRGRSFTGGAGSCGGGMTAPAGVLSIAGSVLGRDDTNTAEWTVVSPDKKKAAGMIIHKMVHPNTQFEYYRPAGLSPDKRYHFSGRSLKYDVREFGDLINTVAPFHVKQGSVTHNVIAKYVKMDGETEDITAYGDTLMAGIKLSQAFGGTGYDSGVRHFPDFASRIYFMEEC